jgi:hypothetical protein
MLRRLSVWMFGPLDRMGVHILPKHYYSPVPDRAWLHANPGAWRAAIPLAWSLDEQLGWLRETCLPFLAETGGAEGYARFTESGLGLGFGLVEYFVLYGLLRAVRPKRVVEVGGGMTTGIMAEALARNGDGATITTIEPFPSAGLRGLKGVELVEEPAQLVSAETFATLGDGDVLFIDSTHVVKTGSEVPRLFLEVVPGLAPGVYVHVHDVTLPYLYHRTLGRDWYDWQETSLVLALLTGNERLQTLACLSALHYARQDELWKIFPAYRPQRELVDGLADPADEDGHFPSSLWLRTR